jgi:hypothetical protein
MCRKVAGGYTIQGIFSEETVFCHAVADNAADSFLPLAKYTTHMHLGVNNYLREGQLPGQDGAIDVESYKTFLHKYIEEIQKHHKKPVSAVLELQEEDYTNCKNAWTMLSMLREFWD